MGTAYVPLWLAGAYLASNIVLNCLNIFWFGKMVATIRSRFAPPFGTKGVGIKTTDSAHTGNSTKDQARAAADSGLTPGKPKGSVSAAHARADAALETRTDVARGVYEDGHKSVEVTGSMRKSARSRRKA